MWNRAGSTSRVEAPEDYRPHIHHPVTMSFVPTPEGKQNALRVLFRCVSSFLERQDRDVFYRIELLQNEFLKSFRSRLDGTDIDSMDLFSIAKVLTFNEEEANVMMQVVEIYGADETKRAWSLAEVDQANHFIKVLVGGNQTTYPDVDSPSWSDADGGYTRYLRNVLSLLRNSSGETLMADRVSAVSDIHYRNDQGRLAENLELQERENAEAMNYAESIDYSQWKYGAVVIVGHSPTKAEASEGKTCSRMTRDKIERSVSVNRNNELAPLYIVCGGSVRPQLTRVNEAYSMKKYLTEVYNIPKHRILIDATSEHTYSNFMNAVLIARKVKMPTGTKLAVFLVPDRYGNEDQYEFCVNKLLGRADDEVYPSLKSYFSMEVGTEERSVDLVLEADTKDFLAPILLWKDYTGEL